MRGLLTKSLREVWFVTVLLGTALMIFMALLTFILPMMQADLSEFLLKMPFVRTMVSALLGIDAEADLTARMMQSILWVHPVVLATTWTHEIILTTRMPAGEIDRGSIDVLLGWPVSRRKVYCCETLMWLVTGAAILSMGVVGHSLTAGGMAPETRPRAGEVLLILANLYCLYVAVGGVSFLASALSDRRGRAVGIVLGLVLASFLLTFLGQFWEPAKRFAFLSVLEYYRPAEVLRGAGAPWRDGTVLLLVGAAAWACGGEVVARRSICTV